MRRVTLCVCAIGALLAGGCRCPVDVTLNNGDVVTSLYYHERRVEGELMIEMWIDFPTRRLRFKCSPHDALGWESRRFDSWRLDVVLSCSEFRRIAECIKLAEIEFWEGVKGKDTAPTLDVATYYVRLKTANGGIERLVSGDAPMRFEHFREVLRFSASHINCRYEVGERTSRTNYWVRPYGS